MKKISSSLVLSYVAVSILLLACSHDGEAMSPLPDGIINAANRRGMKTSEVTGLFHCDPFDTTPEEFQNAGFPLKTHQMFSVHNTREELKNTKMTAPFGYCIWKKEVEERNRQVIAFK